MKKVLNYILLTAILGTFLPYSVLAETTNVGVNITGSVSIDVVTTISADITLDLTTGETTPTYMEIQNNSSVPVNAKITNISTTSEGAPSTFAGFMEKDWYNLTKEETKTYVNFNILDEGQNVSAQDILANTEIDLGVLGANVDIGGFGCGEYPCFVPTDPNAKIFEIKANFGMNWDEGDKNFTYQITTVYSQADSYADPTLFYTYPDTDVNFAKLLLSGISSTVDIDNIDQTKTYVSFEFEGNELVENGLNNVISQIIVTVNGEQAVYAGQNVKAAENYVAGHLHYAITKLSDSGYLNIKLTYGNNTYTYIAKIVVE